MNLYPTKATCCTADIRKESTVQEEVRGTFTDDGRVVWSRKRAKRIFHYRELDKARFWHWSDQETEDAPIFMEEE